jgi:hypothetical protein
MCWSWVCFAHLARNAVPRGNECELCFGALNAPVSSRIPAGFKCGLCSRKFSRTDKFIAHATSHTKIKVFHCGSCPRQFSHHAHRVKHQQYFHEQPEEDAEVIDEAM